MRQAKGVIGYLPDGTPVYAHALEGAYSGEVLATGPPRPGWWTRLCCALWWGHRPVRIDYSRPEAFARDKLTCRCGKVTAPAEEVFRYTG